MLGVTEKDTKTEEFWTNIFGPIDIRITFKDCEENKNIECDTGCDSNVGYDIESNTEFVTESDTHVNAYRDTGHRRSVRHRVSHCVI